MTRRTFTRVVLAELIVGLLALGMASGMLYQQHRDAAQAPADITVMPCSAWANQQYPTIPANTLTDACVDDTGTLHTAPTSTWKTR